MRMHLPFTIYDPQMMAAWVENVWQAATTQGKATALGVEWSARAMESAHQIVHDATCVAPQTLGYTADNDDLFLDSDAP